MSAPSPGPIELTLPSGAPFSVLDDESAQYAQGLVDKYNAEFEFSSVSDLQDLDSVIIDETHIHRWNNDLSLGTRNGRPVDGIELRKRLKEGKAELRQLKKSLGIDKISRERARGEGSVPAYIASVLERAEHFGINRNEMSAKAIELAMQATALITLHDNCTDVERREQHCEDRDILDWFRTVFIPEFAAVDAHFREHDQKMWISSQ